MKSTIFLPSRRSCERMAEHLTSKRKKCWFYAIGTCGGGLGKPQLIFDYAKMRWTGDGHRKTHHCRNPTASCSRPGHRGRITALYQQEILACVSALSPLRLAIPQAATFYSRKPCFGTSFALGSPIQLPLSSVVPCRTASAYLDTECSHN